MGGNKDEIFQDHRLHRVNVQTEQTIQVEVPQKSPYPPKEETSQVLGTIMRSVRFLA